MGTGVGGGRGIVEVTVDDAVVDAGESRSGVELDAEGVEVVEIVDVDAVLEADSNVDEVVEEGCVRSVCVEEDATLEIETDVVEEDVTSEDVEIVASDEIVEVVDDESAVWAEEK